LRAGVYQAKYFLLSNLVSSKQVSANQAFNTKVDLEVRVVLKKDSNAGPSSIRGGLDLNVILVGSSNVNDAATLAGQRNLNALFGIVHDILKQSNSKVHLANVQAYDWDDSLDGDSWADVSLAETGTLFFEGSQGVEETEPAQAINLFLVNRVTAGSSGTILGRAGGVPGPPLNATLGSGVVIPLFEMLANFNPDCSGQATCPTAALQAVFLELGATIAHEIGHYLALNHPSERDGETHDAITDTPICTNKSGTSLTLESCFSDTNPHPTLGGTCAASCTSYNGTTQFCPTVQQCQFNHVMWWTDKGIVDGGLGDGNLFSVDSSDIINMSPFVR
jgi:hypothetical protein